MKIGYVLDDGLDRPDGVQQAVLTTGEWFRGKGHDVHYLVGHTTRNDIENVHSLARSFNVKFNGNRMTTPLPTSRKMLERFLQMQKFDVLHIQMPYSPYFAARVIRSAPKGTKILGTFHILPYSKLNQNATKLLGKILRSSLKRFDGFISVSKPAAVFAKATFGIDSIVVPNPVATDQFIKAKKDKNEKIKRIVFLGRLEERKGVVELVKAYGKLIEDNPKYLKNTQLTIGGKGPLKDTVHGMLLSLPHGAHIEMLGFVPENEKAELLASASVAALPSTSGESFGIILVEAMAAGSRIVIAGNNPGYTSVLGDKPELLVDPRDTETFAKKLQWALSDTAETKALDEWLRSEVDQYDVSHVGQRLLELYSA